MDIPKGRARSSSRGRVPPASVGAALLVLGAMVAPIDAAAHVLERSYGRIERTPAGARLTVDFDPDDFTDPQRRRFDDDHSDSIDTAELERHHRGIADRLLAGSLVSRGAGGCSGEIEESRPISAVGMLHVVLSYRCTETGPLRLEMPLFDALRPGHAHFVTVGDGDSTSSVVLTTRSRTLVVEPSGSLLTDVGRFFVLGVEHIVIGYDHLLFLLALILIPMSLRRVVGIITAFTAAHTVTLVGSALGAFSLPPAVVEPAIALSIIFVGIENLFTREATRRWLVAFALGLIHGFGFAFILAEVGLPEEGRLLSLLAFNLGVEAGQLTVVAVVLPALVALRAAEVSTRARLTILAGALALAAPVALYDPGTAVGLVVIAVAAVLFIPRFTYDQVMRRGVSIAVALLGALWLVLRLGLVV